MATDTDTSRSGERIAKLLARAGVASRREVERMIEDGRIALNGTVLDTPATILRNLAGVTVDGDPVAAPAAARLFVYHKPAGLLVTEHDPAGRPIIYDRLPADLPRVVPVGRLDLATEGLLLLTTDGGLKRQLELPATGVERAYRARAYGEISQAQLEDLAEGVEIEGVRYGPIDANLERRTGANVWIELILTEGKNREVRRVLEYLGLQVGRLIRTRYGPFVLGDLPPGAVGEVRQNDLVSFVKMLDGPRRAKGTDQMALVEVEQRARVARPAPAPASAPKVEAPRPTSRPAAAVPPRAAGGWGSRTRPSRPTDPREPERPERGFAGSQRAARPSRAEGDREARPPRASTSDQSRQRPPRGETDRPARDDTRRPARNARPPSPFAADPRRDRAVRAASPDARTDRGPARSGDDRRPARNDASRADNRPARPGAHPGARATQTRGRTDSDPRAIRTDRPIGSVKGPAGGRGHPPRTPKGTPRGAPKGGPRGRR